MARMKTLITYGLCIVGFIFLSMILEDALIGNMYITMRGESPKSELGVEIDDIEARASNVNGFMSFKITDNSQDGKLKYAKVDLYNKKGNLVATKYIPLDNLDENKQKEIAIKIKGQEIKNYKISVIDELPDKSNIIKIFGWEFDSSNVLGYDLSNVSVFGKKLTEWFSANDVFSRETFNKDNIIGTAKGVWGWFVSLASSVPWWGYAIGGGIVLFYMPAKFLFGFFPL